MCPPSIGVLSVPKKSTKSLLMWPCVVRSCITVSPVRSSLGPICWHGSVSALNAKTRSRTAWFCLSVRPTVESWAIACIDLQDSWQENILKVPPIMFKSLNYCFKTDSVRLLAFWTKFWLNCLGSVLRVCARKPAAAKMRIISIANSLDKEKSFSASESPDIFSITRNMRRHAVVLLRKPRFLVNVLS